VLQSYFFNPMQRHLPFLPMVASVTDTDVDPLGCMLTDSRELGVGGLVGPDVGPLLGCILMDSLRGARSISAANSDVEGALRSGVRHCDLQHSLAVLVAGRVSHRHSRGHIVDSGGRRQRDDRRTGICDSHKDAVDASFAGDMSPSPSCRCK